MGYGMSYMAALLAAFAMPGAVNFTLVPQRQSATQRGAAPALGNSVNSRYSGGGAARGQKQRRKIARQTTRRNRGVRCQGRPAGSGRTHR